MVEKINQAHQALKHDCSTNLYRPLQSKLSRPRFSKKFFISPPLGHGYASCQSAPSPALCFPIETPNVTVSTLNEDNHAKRSKWAKAVSAQSEVFCSLSISFLILWWINIFYIYIWAIRPGNSLKTMLHTTESYRNTDGKNVMAVL